MNKIQFLIILKSPFKTPISAAYNGTFKYFYFFENLNFQNLGKFAVRGETRKYNF